MIAISEPFNVWGGPRPQSLASLKALGITRIISLESGVYQTLKVYTEPTSDMFQFPCEYGMKEYNMPCSDFTAPDRRYVEKILRMCYDREETYIHCLSGRDRTGFVGAVLKMRLEDWTYEQALAWWKDLRHPWYFYWESELKKWTK